MKEKNKEIRAHRRSEISVHPMWVGQVAVTGAYWFQSENCEPVICWIHGDSVNWTDGGKTSASELSTQLGNCFYGPLPVPSTDKEAA